MPLNSQEKTAVQKRPLKGISWTARAVSLIRTLFYHKAQLIASCSKYFSTYTPGEFLVPLKPFTSVGCISPFVFYCKLLEKRINYMLLNPGTVIINKFFLKRNKYYWEIPLYLSSSLTEVFVALLKGVLKVIFWSTFCIPGWFHCIHIKPTATRKNKQGKGIKGQKTRFKSLSQSST